MATWSDADALSEHNRHDSAEDRDAIDAVTCR